MNRTNDPVTQQATQWLAQREGIFRLRDGRPGCAFDALHRTRNFINYDIKYRMGNDLVAEEE